VLWQETAHLCPGAPDRNSIKPPILPWLRSLDGLNTHDDVCRLAVAGAPDWKRK
jgi:hypothetical protein